MSYSQKKCKYCNAQFEPKNWANTTCSPSCRTMLWRNGGKPATPLLPRLPRVKGGR